MHKRRQRRALAAMLATAIAALGLLGAAACSPAAQSDARAAQTTIAAVQATAQPVATRVAAGLARLQAPDLGRLIGTTLGANVEVAITPPDAPNEQVTQATLNGTDRTGVFSRLDDQARRAMAGASLQLARQAYPRAHIDMSIVDGEGHSLLAATYPPDGSPTFQ